MTGDLMDMQMGNVMRDLPMELLKVRHLEMNLAP